MPLNTVEKTGFKHLIKMLDPRYKIPGRNYFSQTAMLQPYDNEEESWRLIFKMLNTFLYLFYVNMLGSLF